jgi:hypothetical protein
MLELMAINSADDPAPVAPRDAVLVKYQDAEHWGTVRAQRTGYLLIDVETAKGPLLVLVDPDAILENLGRAS